MENDLQKGTYHQKHIKISQSFHTWPHQPRDPRVMEKRPISAKKENITLYTLTIFARNGKISIEVGLQDPETQLWDVCWYPINCMIGVESDKKISKEQFNRILRVMKDKSKGSDYKCSQVFGYKGSNEKIHEEDIISILKFNHDGSHLALGDKAGRIIIFKGTDAKKKDDRFTYYTEFQAYNREFDPLNSSDIDEEVLGVSWMKPQGQYHKMITMNSKYVKMWKIFQKAQKKLVRSANKQLSLPKFQVLQGSVNAVIQKTFPNKHEQDLVGMDHTNNQQYILCSDTVKTLLWNVEKSKTPYLVADLQKEKRVEDVKENINCLKAHPTSDSMFAYGTNRGTIVLSDARVSESYKPMTFKIDFSKEKANFFTQMISSYSSIDFMNNNKYIVGRDYLSVKVWDITKTDKPILSVTVQESLKSKLCDIFQNDCIFDKFSISVSKDSNTLLTGNYNNCFHAIDVCDSSNTQYQVNYKKQTVSRPMIVGKPVPLNKMDYARKIIAADFHPTTNLLAVASLNCFLIYSM